MRNEYSRWIGLMGWLAVLLFSAAPAYAIWLDEARTIFLTGTFYSQLRLRTEEPRGFNTQVGDWTMLQHRYYVDPQLRVDVLPWIRNQSWGADLEDALEITDMRFFFNPRFEYDGIYDYGPDVFRDELPPQFQKGNRFRLFEVYGDTALFRGRTTVRAGRQNVSWGETDVFRLIDRINPLDNGFGGFLIPLDERRIPLTMLRATLGLPDLPEWGVLNSALEVLIAPDKSLPKGAPATAPWGIQGPPLSPRVAPTFFANLGAIGRPFRGNQLDRPDISLKDSRMGVRLLWNWKDITFTLAHMSTYPDGGTLALRLNRQGDPILKVLFPNMQITGMTASAPIPGTYAVFRSEVAGFFGEPFFIEKQNFSLGAPVPKRNVIRGVIGIDHNQWVRFLNPYQTFSLSGQFFYSNIQGSMAGIKIPLQSVPGRFIDVDRENFVNTLVVNTIYNASFFFNLASVQPAMTYSYEWEGAWFLQPSIIFLRDPFRFRVEYTWLEGRFIGTGLFQDKDNLAFRIDYLL